MGLNWHDVEVVLGDLKAEGVKLVSRGASDITHLFDTALERLKELAAKAEAALGQGGSPTAPAAPTPPVDAPPPAAAPVAAPSPESPAVPVASAPSAPVAPAPVVTPAPTDAVPGAPEHAATPSA